MNTQLYRRAQKMATRLLLLTVLTLCSLQSRASFIWQEVAQKSDFEVSYENAGRTVVIKFPYVINQGSYDWMHAMTVSLSYTDNSQTKSYWVGNLNFFKGNYSSGQIAAWTNSTYPDNKLRYCNYTTNNGVGVAIVPGTTGKSLSGGRSQAYATVRYVLPVGFEGYGKNITVNLGVYWAPDDYATNNKGPIVNGGSVYNTGSNGYFYFDLGFTGINIPALVNTPSIGAITPKNSGNVDVAFTNLDGDVRYLDVFMYTKPHMVAKSTTETKPGGTNFFLHFWIPLPTTASTYTYTFSWKKWVDENYTAGFNLKSNYYISRTYGGTYESGYPMKHYSDAQIKEFLYALFLESHYKFYAINDKQIGTQTLRKTSDVKDWNPATAQAYYLTAERVLTNKQIKLTWQAPYHSDFNASSSTYFMIERSDNGGQSYSNVSSLVDYSSGTISGNVKTFSYTDTYQSFEEGKEYTYRISRPVYGAYEWYDGAATTKITLNYSDMIPTGVSVVAASASSVKLRWTNKGTPFTKYEILRRVNNSGAWSVIQTYTVSPTTEMVNGVSTFTHTDNSLTGCSTYEYKVRLTNSSLSFESLSSSSIFIGSTETTDIINFTASKGLYADKVGLEFDLVNGTSNLLVKRRVYESGEWITLNSTPTNGSGTRYYYNDLQAAPGIIYEYMIAFEKGCSGNKQPVFSSTQIGFRRSSATITGRVSFGSGTAVQNVRIAAKPINIQTLNRGKALYATGSGTDAVVNTTRCLLDPKNDFTFQAWVYIDTENGAGNATLIEKTNGYLKISLLANPNATEVHVQLNNCDVISLVSSSVSNTGGPKWRHITVTRKGNAFNAYENGQLLNTFPFYPNMSCNPAAANLGNPDVIQLLPNSSNRAIDEVRLWSKALTAEEVYNTYQRMISGSEEGLVGYWKFDEGIRHEFYDYSFTLGTANQRHGTLTSTYTHTTNIPTEDQLGYAGVTDAYGNYTISGIPYASEGSSYRAIPMLGTHEFNPKEEVLFIDPSSYVHNKINFTDVSSFPVTGKVYYQNTRFPVENADVYVDGIAAVKNGKMINTNSFGEFTVEVPIGRHHIEVRKAGHSFMHEGRFPSDPDEKYLFNQPLSIDTPFYDITKVRVIGRIAGGPIEAAKAMGFSLSKNNVGASHLVLQARFKENYPLLTAEYDEVWMPNERIDTIMHPYAYVDDENQVACATQVRYNMTDITIIPDANTGEFFADLIPENFNVLEVAAGHENDGTTVYKLPQELRAPLELKNYAGLKMHIVREDKKDSVSYGGVSQKYMRRNTPQISVTNTADNAVSPALFGEEKVNFFNPGTNKPEDVSVINRATQSYSMNGMPVFKMGNLYKHEVSVYERYNKYNGGALVATSDVPVTDGQLIINNYLARNTLEYLTLDSMGKAIYSFVGGSPSLAINAQDGLMNYTKTFNITAATGENRMQKTSWRPEANPLRGYLLGAAVTGSNFTTRGPKNVVTVLRDPPGSTSYSNMTTNVSYTYEKTLQQTHGLSALATADVVCGAKVLTGFGVITEALDNENMIGGGIETTEQWTKGNTYITQTSFTQSISSSEANTFVGAMADVVVGYAENIVYSEATSLNIYKNGVSITGLIDGTEIDLGNGYYFAQRAAIDITPEFDTHFMYTVTGIENKVIPDLIMLRNSMLYYPAANAPNPNSVNRTVYVSNIPPSEETFGHPGTYEKRVPSSADTISTDSVALYNKDIEGWKKVLADNEHDKVFAINGGAKAKNISFEAGTVYEQSTQLDTVSTSFDSFDYTADAIAHGSVALSIMGVGIRIESEGKQTNSGSNNYGNTTGNSTAYSYRLSDDNPGDFFTVDVYESPKGWGPIFRTRGGQSSCPYEDAVYAKYYEPERAHMLSQATAQIEKPKIAVEPAVRSNVPGNKAAVYTLVLENESETNDDYEFVIKVADGTNPNGAVLAIDGLPIGNGRNILVPAGGKTYKTLTLSRTKEDVFEYDSIEIELRSLCQCSVYDQFPDIKSTTTISAYFVPACGDIEIKSPVTGLIVNQSQMDTTNIRGLKGKLPIAIGSFDINNSVLQTITLYYKASTESDNKWKMLVQYAKSPAGSQKQLEGSSLTYIWDMTDAPNRTYQFKAVAQGTGAESSESNIISVVKDDKSPKVFGKPQPANGILSASDDISITFDEEVDPSLIMPELYDNIRVTGLLPGNSVKHSAGVSFDGATGHITVPDKVNLNSNFTIDFWIRRNRMSTRETVLLHGTEQKYLAVGFTADNKVFVKFNGAEYTSSMAVTNSILVDEWAHMGIACSGTSLTVYINSDNYLLITNANPYANMAILTLGRSASSQEYFSGKIHELRVWTKSMDVADIAAYRNHTLSGKENNLYSNWEMNEAFGTVAKDKVRGRNASVSASWFVEPVGKAKQLNGTSQYVSVPMKNIKPDDDYTVEMWFKGGAGNTSATLAANGKGVGEINSRDQFNLCFIGNKLNFVANGVTTKVSDENYLDNKWHHVAIAVNHTGNAVFCVDGVVKNYRVGNTLGGLTGASFSLGACVSSSATAGYFNGSIDEFRYWRMYRSEELIRQNLSAKLQGNEAGLTAYYPFEAKGANNTIVDNNANQTAAFSSETATLQGGVTTVEGAAVKEAPAIEKIPFTWALNRDKLVITLSEREDYQKRMEGCILTVSVKDLYDKCGNPSEPVAWTAYVERNQLKWSEPEMTYTIAQGEGITFEATIVNLSGNVQDFNLSQVPTWLSVSATSGKVQPHSNTKLTFTVSKEVGVGNYEQQLYLNGKLLSDMLKLRLKVAAQKPNWTVAEGDQSMSIIGKIKIDGYFSSDKEDMVAAFINGQCVGVASPKYFKEYDTYYLFMSIYNPMGSAYQPITFSIWEARTGNVYPQVATSSAVAFTPNGLYGSISNPMLFSTESNVLEQSIPLKAGWNWVSFNVQSLEPANFRSNLSSAGSSINTIKSNSVFRQRNSVTGAWDGTLPSIEVGKMYSINANSTTTLRMVGKVSNNAPVLLSQGWSWIGYVPQSAMSLDEAMAGLQASEGDVIKSQRSFATYTTANGWLGTLEYMEPGKGYMYKAANTTSFSYPTASLRVAGVAARVKSTKAKEQVSMAAKRWNFEPSAYPLNMIMVAVLYKDGTECNNSSYEIGVFDKNGVCRGSEALQHNDATGQYLAYLTIMGEQSGEELSLKVYSTADTKEYAVVQKLTFAPDAMLGSISNPYVLLTGNATPVVKLADTDNRILVYPNPAKSQVYVQTVGIAAHSVRITAVDGTLIESRDMESNYLNINHLSPGIYFLRFETSAGAIVKQIIKQ